MTTMLSWHYKYLHEINHWIRFHGSSIGILLTFLQRSRDALATTLLNSLSNNEKLILSYDRSNGHKLLDYRDSYIVRNSDPQICNLGLDWLDLHSAFLALLNGGTTDELRVADVEPVDIIDRALAINWAQWQNKGMLDRSSARGVSHVTGISVALKANSTTLTTALLLECAAALDEGYPLFRGSLREFTDPALQRMLKHTMSGSYGIPYWMAERIAGRAIGPNVVLAMIDFALNPPIPGLHYGISTVRWEELYPPCRFLAAAMSLTKNPVALEYLEPEPEVLLDSYRKWEIATGLRMGRVDALLTDISNLSGAAELPWVTERIPHATLMYSIELLRERKRTPHTLSHVGLNFVGDGALRFVDPSHWWVEGNWWLFPPLRAQLGVYCWPSERLDQDQATSLFIGSAVSSALDDILHNIGPLSNQHLPWTALEDPGELAALNNILHTVTGFKIGW
ncbi:hypothetical protein [Nocardia sp. NPDC127526]|uniref:hypothetical protein n=1 Tax=Nocardia sp. NPDC127526 TaxID=3345393 RepID=UPI0036391BF8